jgi:mixed-linked glucan synthase
MNSVVSILAADYPIDRYACYVLDDSGSLILYEALVESANFATLWAPFCSKHCTEPRALESYFALELQPHTGQLPEGFINEYKRIHMEYDNFNMRLDNLSNTIIRCVQQYENFRRRCKGNLDGQWDAMARHMDRSN